MNGLQPGKIKYFFKLAINGEMGVEILYHAKFLGLIYEVTC